MPEGYAVDWMAIAIAGAVAFGAMAAMFLANVLVAPRRSHPDKEIPYESGIPPTPFRWSQLHVRYYIFAIFFLIFDVEAVFLFPWAMVFLEDVPAAVFYEMLLFIGVLLVGLGYAWRKGVLEWR